MRTLATLAATTLLFGTLAVLPAAHATRAAKLAKLKRGIRPNMTRRQKLTKLMANMKTFGFKYKGSGKPVDTVLDARVPEGDCGTLVSLFMHVAQTELGMTGLKRGIAHERIFLRGGGMVVDRARGKGNVHMNNRPAHWFFSGGHVWAVDEEDRNRVYDVLFNQQYAEEGALRAKWNILPKGPAGASFKYGVTSYYLDEAASRRKGWTVYTNRRPGAAAGKSTQASKGRGRARAPRAAE